MNYFQIKKRLQVVTLYRAMNKMGLGALLLMVGLGCGKPPVFTVQMDPQRSYYFTKYKIVVDGRDLITSTGNQPIEFEVPGHKADTAKEMLSGVEAQVFSVCGWEKADVTFSVPSSDEIEHARVEHHNPLAHMYLRFAGEESKTFEILVDNRGAPEAHVSVGKFDQAAEAGDSPTMIFPDMPHCPEADQIRLNGEAVGSVKELRSTETDAQLLLDTSGSRCYRYEWQRYSNMELGIPSHGAKVLRAQKLRMLSGHVNHFLTPLPSDVWSSDQIVVRGALMQIPCH